MTELAKEPPHTWKDDIQKLVLGAISFNLGFFGLLLRFGIIQFSESAPEEWRYILETLTHQILFIPACITLFGLGTLFIWIVLDEPIKQLRAWLKNN
ncbi:hypothetical protein I7Z51_002567 [Vibrio parahaemolyticus]|uniref:hypothetical protein n=1 Tax=Vibrio TaxID=662 RepID=UPI001A8CFA8B|nr:MULTISPECIES: hypothetical protein [Vibrio]EGQ7973642.1 hypothetical protein [Vibrio parahaemolyticus]MBO0209851.1 hypothetical protein [Vibrio sp. Vb0877]MBO0216660.1 hypothetical protein [Vibrio sp. Vb2880]MCR9811914.1 hypothetical protein [Vibrio parahaemolyticus]